MQEPVAYARLVNISWLRIGDFESLVATMMIRLALKIILKTDNVPLEIERKLRNILFVFLSWNKFLPCDVEVFEGYDIVIGNVHTRIFDAYAKPASKPPPTGVFQQ